MPGELPRRTGPGGHFTSLAMFRLMMYQPFASVILKIVVAFLVGSTHLAFIKSPAAAVETYVLPTTSQPAVKTLALEEPATESVLPATRTEKPQRMRKGRQRRLRDVDDKQLGAQAERDLAEDESQQEDQEPLSAIEEFYSKAPGLEGTPLRQFGYEIFNTLKGGVVATETSVPPSYPIGPGDELIINVPLSTQELRAVVGRDGTIFIPNFGSLTVAGQSLIQFERAIRAKARASGITVRLGKLRSLTVYLSGRVKRPGSFTVSALSTITTLLQAAGGVAKNGSLRLIQVRRNGRTVNDFDFYDFLLKGESAGNIRLEAGDVVFVPTIGHQVAVAGAVHQPAIYEVRDPTTVHKALDLAGGPLAQSYLKRVVLQRVRTNVGREVREVDLTDPKFSDWLAKNGDLVVVSPILDRIENGVVLEGHVERPGLYEIKPKTRVSQLIGKLADLRPETYLEYAQILRRKPPDLHAEVVSFNLGKALAGDPNHDPALEPSDTIQVFSLKHYDSRPEVNLYGAVLRPGKYRLYPNMRVSQLLGMGGGLLPEADQGAGEITRSLIGQDSARVVRLQFSPTAVFEAGSKAPLDLESKSDPVLQRGDAILVKTVPNFQPVSTVDIQGEVAQPGVYGLAAGENLSSVIERAGGFTSRAYLPGGVMTRESVRRVQNEQLTSLADRLERSILGVEASPVSSQRRDAIQQATAVQRELLARLRRTQATGRIVIKLAEPGKLSSAGDDILLEAGDKVYVPPYNESISVLGAVYSPNAFKFKPDLSVSDYLREAGGASRHGDGDNLYVVRADGKLHSLATYSEGWWLFSRNLLASRLNPGDTIVVPERIDYRDALVDIAQLTQILAQTATTAGVLYGIFRPTISGVTSN